MTKHHSLWFVPLLACGAIACSSGKDASGNENSSADGGNSALDGTGASAAGDIGTGASSSSQGSGGTTAGGGSLGTGGTSMGGTGTGTGGTAATGGNDDGSGGAAPGSGGAAPATCSGSDWSPGDQTVSFNHDGEERSYEVHVPPGYSGTSEFPLLLMIHGAHNTPGMMRNWSQMDSVADENGIIVAYPAGLDCWNTGTILPGCTAADDDIGFLLEVVNDVTSHACVDSKRVFAAGISNGSMMAQTLGCVAADIFGAVGGVAAGVFGGCTPSRPISVFYLHGTEDTTVGYSSAGPNVTGWATRNGCLGEPINTYDFGSTSCETYQDCDAGVEVDFCTVNGMGHCWPEDTSCGPGGGPEFGVDDFQASPRLWDFFVRHPLP